MRPLAYAALVTTLLVNLALHAASQVGVRGGAQKGCQLARVIERFASQGWVSCSSLTLRTPPLQESATQPLAPALSPEPGPSPPGAPACEPAPAPLGSPPGADPEHPVAAPGPAPDDRLFRPRKGRMAGSRMLVKYKGEDRPRVVTLQPGRSVHAAVMIQNLRTGELCSAAARPALSQTLSALSLTVLQAVGIADGASLRSNLSAERAAQCKHCPHAMCPACCRRGGVCRG